MNFFGWLCLTAALAHIALFALVLLWVWVRRGLRDEGKEWYPPWDDNWGN